MGFNVSRVEQSVVCHGVDLELRSKDFANTAATILIDLIIFLWEGTFTLPFGLNLSSAFLSWYHPEICFGSVDCNINKS